MNKRFLPAASLGVLSLLLAACGDSSQMLAGTPATPTPVTPPTPIVPVNPVVPTTPPGTTPTSGKDRYAFNNKCVALRDNVSGKYVAITGANYAANADALAGAEPFVMKPTLLGEYALMNRAGTLMNAAATVGTVAIATATDTASFKLLVDGDTTTYPPAPKYDIVPTPALISSYRNFSDPLVSGSVFTLENPANGQRLRSNGTGALTMSTGSDPAQRFRLEEVTGCAVYPEASSNASGETFKGTTSDGRVLGMADVHVHTSSSTFLGGALSGQPFNKFGPLQAMKDCSYTHGQMGSQDVIGAAFVGDTNGHRTDGWPTFSEWPTRDSLSHRAIYWKWIERAWLGGLRVMVNDVVENATLCELQRNLTNQPDLNCNEMNGARKQIGTMYAMQDYIDAQYGGRGKGFFRIVLSPAEARSVIADGKMALVLGIEISNLFNCQVTYMPTRQKEPFQEDGSGGIESSYSCAMTETGAPNEIKGQIEEMKALGVRQIITIHEFDNAFGGNGIFDDLILNQGNRENSGGIPSGSPSGIFQSDPESPTGEFWTTYDCPQENVTPGFSGYLWGGSGGSMLRSISLPPPSPTTCPFTGQGMRPGGTTNCYPAKNQCNARWLTPIGLYTYKKLMENGIIFDIDHLETAMKTQALELAEAQNPVYPFVSTHGTFGGTTVDQAGRILKNGGFLYPSLGSQRGFVSNMAETRAVGAAAGSTEMFGFGFGTDTDGLSGQEGPRGASNIAAGKEVKYPFTLFSTPPFNALPDFAGKSGVVFNQPEERNAAGAGRKWSQDADGNAHYGMMADFVEEMRQDATPQEMQALFNAAERYLRTWERTEASAASINSKGIVTPEGILRASPKAPYTTSPYK